jgi:hypothetical protein
VRSRQGEAGRVVIELAVCPYDRVMAFLARCGEAGMGYRASRRVVIVLMTADAGRVGKVVVVVDVAIGALARRHGMASRQREAGRVVIEGRIEPGTRAVALIAGLGEVSGNVVRIRRALKVFQVAGYARRARQIVVVVEVAVGTLPRRNRMQSRQGKPGRVVIEGRIEPGTGAVTLRTSLGKIRTHVVRIRGALEVLQVARYAVGIGQVVVVVDVAVGAQPRRHRVHAGQRESCRGVVEGAIRPQNRVVTAFASRREAGRRMGNRTGCVVVIGLVAGNTRGARDVVVVINVAIRASARRYRVRTGQRETGVVVVKTRIQPRRSGVALIAGLRKVPGNVVRIGRSLEILQVAGHAGRAAQAVVVVRVAIGAQPRRHRVHASQRESRSRVVKLAIRPDHGVMALLAGRRETGMEHGSSRRVEIVLVTTEAGRAGQVVVIVDMAVRA